MCFEMFAKGYMERRKLQQEPTASLQTKTKDLTLSQASLNVELEQNPFGKGFGLTENN